RHTRSLRDWSSDVCSSDLPELRLVKMTRDTERIVRLDGIRGAMNGVGDDDVCHEPARHEEDERRTKPAPDTAPEHDDGEQGEDRSEERRVGKEGRARGAGC